MAGRRGASQLPVVLFAACLGLLALLRSDSSTAQPFVATGPASVPRGRVALRGFKEDFDAWKSSLSSEEAAMVREQAEGEFDKKFRKTDSFKQNLPDEKLQSFSKVLGKFFEAEAADYQKEMETKAPDYDGLLKKTGDKKVFDFSLKSSIVEIDRDADRRYNSVMMKIRKAKAEGKGFMPASPYTEVMLVKNDDAESHADAENVLGWMKELMANPDCPPEAKASMEEWVKKGVPAMGEEFRVLVPKALMEQMETNMAILAKAKEDGVDGKDIARLAAHSAGALIKAYVEARDEVSKDVETMKAFFRSQKKDDRTKADVLKEIWAELPKMTDKPVPPIDEELLAELAEKPAVVEGEFKHIWGTADKLYKSEAIDAFGMKYLLGVFEEEDEARKAFDDWNKEYEAARAEMKVELEQWGKQEQARMEKDTAGTERIKAVLDAARR